MKIVLVGYLYFSSLGEKFIYCQKITESPAVAVEGFADETFVALQCDKGMENANIPITKLDPSLIVTIGSRTLELSQYDKTIAKSLYSKVSKK